MRVKRVKRGFNARLPAIKILITAPPSVFCRLPAPSLRSNTLPSFLRKQESSVVNFCRKAKLDEGKCLNAVNDAGFLLSQE
ncbi:MAG: hypothetical protein ACR2P5_02950 [Gammaproteobacteria bacterium]